MNNFYNPYLYNSHSDSSFLGYYITDYSEVLNTAVPANGQAVIFANLEQGVIYSKKIVNGIPTIQPYSITPIFQEATKQQGLVNNNLDIAEELKAIRAEIANMKGVEKDDAK